MNQLILMLSSVLHILLFKSTISTKKTDMKYKERIEMFTAYF